MTEQGCGCQRSICRAVASKTQTYAALLYQLATKARNVVRVLDDQDELAFFRIRSNKHEIMVAPDPEYLLIVVQENVK